MYDPTFHRRTLSAELRQHDFEAIAYLSIPAYQAATIEQAQTTARSGFTELRLRTSTLRGKPIYQLDRLSDELILRKLERNIRRLTKVRQGNREIIVRSVRAILGEGLNYRVYKIDVQSFYESVDIADLLQRLEADAGFSRESLRLLRTFLDVAQASGIVGLPRGISLSATLAEYVMRDFDERMKSTDGIHFYIRYVDDILILTPGTEDSRAFLRTIKANLPSGLLVNRDKSRSCDFHNAAVTAPDVLAGEIDFLGYRFRIFERRRSQNRTIVRKVQLDIAPRKISKIKTRYVKSFITFLEDRDFLLLKDRLKLLTGNCSFFDHKKKIRRSIGLYCNYRLVDFAHSTSLKDLDLFTQGLLCGKSSALSDKIKAALPSASRKELLKLRFEESFKERVFYHFPADRLGRLKECWAYV